MMRLLAIFLLAQVSPGIVRVQDEGTTKGYVDTLNCVGAGIACTVSGQKATVTVAGGSGSPGGSSGNLQTNNGAGAFGAYGGASCSYAVKSLDASGAASCTAAPTIPTDISGAHYVTTQAEAGLSAEAVVPTCTGTDKLTFNGTILSCATDQTGSGAPTGATYITETADATLTNEFAMGSLGTGLVKNTTTTGVPSIYGGTTCTNQFPRSLDASGAATCASVALGSDVTGTTAIANGGTNNGALAVTNGGVIYSDGSKLVNTGAGTSGQALYSAGAAAPVWNDAMKVIRLTSDYTNATTSLTSTALTWNVAISGITTFQCVLLVKSSATTLGAQITIAQPPLATSNSLRLQWTSAAGTAPATGGTMVFVDQVGNSAMGPTTGLTSYTTWFLSGNVTASASSGSVTIQAKASGSGTITVAKGSYCEYFSF